MFPWLAFGHIVPFLELAQQLARRGHFVTFVSAPRNLARLRPVLPELKPRIRLPHPLPRHARRRHQRRRRHRRRRGRGPHAVARRAAGEVGAVRGVRERGAADAGARPRAGARAGARRSALPVGAPAARRGGPAGASGRVRAARVWPRRGACRVGAAGASAGARGGGRLLHARRDELSGGELPVRPPDRDATALRRPGPDGARLMAERRVGLEVPWHVDGGRAFASDNVAAAVRRVMVEEEGEVFAGNARKLREILWDTARQED
ncbi:unnamed protein product [Urochloa decumbens]|uniref:Uncharacterized protein n=1 Tax=Urochloa decumbens TaxID=240449 RepID=A0ABC9F1N1_9POAL